MRTYGTGSIRRYQTQQGERWRAALPALSTGGRKRYKSYRSKEEAEQALAAAMLAVSEGRAEAPGPLTLGQYGERWLALATHRSANDDRSRWRRHIASRPIAAMALQSIRAGHIKRLIEGLARTRKLVPTPGKLGARAISQDTMSAQSIRHVFGLLRRVLGDALVDGHIEANPCAGYRLPPIEKQRMETPPVFLTAEEINQVLTCSEIPLKYRLCYEVAIFTGLREGELWGLRWQDLDLERSTCAAKHSYSGPTKGNKVRRFTLLPRAAAALRRWRDLTKWTKSSDYVFPGPRGRQHADGYDAEWGGEGKYREKAGIRPEVRFHDFRHTFCSHLAMGTWGERWTLQDIQQYIAHSSIGVTQRYSHLSPSHLADLAARTIGSEKSGHGRSMNSR